MKVVMINDCAYVGETLIKFLPSEVQAIHLKRSRGAWDKTFGLAWRILRASADVFHVNYLLQDCYLASRFGKRPLVGHAHGSDLRLGLKHKVWCRIVRSNLKHCDKVLVSTPDLIEITKDYRTDTEYLPNPVDTAIFYEKPVETQRSKIRVLIASGCDWRTKGTDIVIRALSRMKDVETSIIQYGKDFAATVALAESLGMHLKILPKVSHQNLRDYYWASDVVFDQFTYGVFGMIALEAIACGRPVITYVSSKYDTYKDFPIRDVLNEEGITQAFQKDLQKLWKEEHLYLVENHDPGKTSKNLLRIYESLAES